MIFDLPKNYVKKNVGLIIHWLHDGNVEEDQWEDWNNNIEESVEPENIDSDVPIVGPDNEIGYNDFEHIANLHSI